MKKEITIKVDVDILKIEFVNSWGFVTSTLDISLDNKYKVMIDIDREFVRPFESKSPAFKIIDIDNNGEILLSSIFATSGNFNYLFPDKYPTISEVDAIFDIIKNIELVENRSEEIYLFAKRFFEYAEDFMTKGGDVRGSCKKCLKFEKDLTIINSGMEKI